ncbi:MAG TPA: hypothetical protein VGO83_09395 [Thermoleophilaceae bacterium]|jgi:hypothetical protein|nr:hypothetical protein [Thermoleophilaceae bacterium]
MKRLTLFFILLSAVAAPAASASGGQLLVMQDNSRMLGQPDATAAEFRSLGADVVKIQIHWADVAPVGRSKPSGFDASDPSSYHWNTYPGAVNAVIAAGMRPFVSIGGPAPAWASGSRGRHGTYRPSAKEFRLFAQAAGRQFANVHIWSIWNEPNLYSWLSPQRKNGVPQAPSIYRRLYLAGHGGLVDSGHGGDTILLGELMPRGGRSAKKIRPLAFLREMACLDSHYRQYRGSAARRRGCGKVGRLPTSGLAYHPYTLPSGPRGGELSDDASVGQLDRVARTLDALGRRGKLPRRLPIWLTEFGYQTSPPDPVFGIPLRRAAAFMGVSEWIAFRNRRVRSYAQYTLVDEPPRSEGRAFARWGTWQSGLRFQDGRPKPRVYEAFRLPFLVRSLGGNAVEIFGGGRGGPGQVAKIAAKDQGHRYRSVASLSVNEAGYFRQIVPLKNAFRKTFRVKLGGSSRTTRPVAP